MNGKRILITGFSGFVARHFLDYLCQQRVEAEVCGVDIREPSFDFHGYEKNISIIFKQVDLTCRDAVRELLAQFVPDYLLHLAAYSSVAYSWRNPIESFMNNTSIFLYLIEELLVQNSKCRVLAVGSSEEYGNVSEEDIPIKESMQLNPLSPYAVAKVSQEMMSKVFIDHFSANIIFTRSFNHIGPGQDERFVVPSFIKRIFAIKKMGMASGIIETGDTSVVRDFVDVRDVVKAYYLLLKSGKIGEVYNICSGNGIELKRLINMVARQLDVEISTRGKADYMRPTDNKIMIGSPLKIQSEFGWMPEIILEQTIHDMIVYEIDNDCREDHSRDGC